MIGKFEEFDWNRQARKLVKDELNKAKFDSPMLKKPTEKYLINIKYSVPTNWFGSPLEVLKTNLHFTKAEKKLESYEIKNIEYGNENGENYTYIYVKLISYLNKKELEEYFKKNNTRIEKIEIVKNI